MGSRAKIWLVVLAIAVVCGAMATRAGGCLPLIDCGAGPSSLPSPWQATSSGAAKVTVADSLTTVRFDQPTPTSGVSAEASLIAARNEFESFQVVVDAGDALKDVEVVPGSSLRGPGGATLPASSLTIYREVPYAVGGSNPGGPPDLAVPQAAAGSVTNETLSAGAQVSKDNGAMDFIANATGSIFAQGWTPELQKLVGGKQDAAGLLKAVQAEYQKELSQ